MAPGVTILQVVPTSRGMEFELKVDPRAIDEVHPGQKAQLMISSFDPQTAPKLKAEVTTISAGAVTDERSGQSYYRVGLSVTPDELARLGDARLVPGMPVEAYLETADRSVLAYLLLPTGSRMLQGASRIVTFDLLEPARLLEFLAGVATAVFGGIGRAVDGLSRPVPFFPSLAGIEASMVLMMVAAAALVIAVSSMVAVALAGRGLLRAGSRRA